MARLKSNPTPPEGQAEAPVFRLDGEAPRIQPAGATPYLLEDSIGLDTWQGKPILTQEQVIAQLDAGGTIGGKTITFGFLDGPTTTGLYNNPRWGFGEPDTYSPMDEAERAATRRTMTLWDDLIPQDIVEKNGNGADILLADSSLGFGSGWAYVPVDGEQHGKTFVSDVWMTPTGELNFGENGHQTLVHEIGHALGLSHPGEYNVGADNDGDGQPDPISYENSAEYAQDSAQYSTMSYFHAINTGGDQIWNISLIRLSAAQTPMLHDILTIQEKYGADPTTRADDTVYFANSTAGNAIYDLEHNPFPDLAVYDAGGNDTFDFSTANRSVFIDLRAGSFSSAAIGVPSLAEANALVEAANAQMAEGDAPRALWTEESYNGWLSFVLTQGQNLEADTGIAGLTTLSPRNVSIAYNTVIENAIGGEARDYLVGNDVANMLEGNAGDDVLNGLGGDDTLWGGEGADEFRFFDLSGNDTIADFASGTDTINLAGIDADTGSAGDQAFTFVGEAAFSGTAGELRSSDGFLAGDVNGDGVADFIIGLGGLPIVLGDIVL